MLLGIIVLVGSYFLPSNPNYAIAKSGSTLRLIGAGLVGLGVLLSSVIQIDAGQIGVTKLFGRVNDGVLESGLHVVNPLLKVVPVNVQTINYTMSGIHDEGKKSGDDAIRVLSADGLELVIDLTVLYHVNKAEAPNIIRNIGEDFETTIVRPVTRTKIRDNAVYYAAVDLYSVKRDEFQARIYKDIEADFKKRGLTLEQLLVRNITLPASVKTTIESKINAEQDAQKMQYVLQKEKQEAERKRVEAQGIADYQKILNTGLSDKLLQYESIKAQKELALSQNAKVIVMGSKSTPIIIGSDK
jgi:regulator of protease activity HflC (stomatin/prohibitin superfamily)